MEKRWPVRDTGARIRVASKRSKLILQEMVIVMMIKSFRAKNHLATEPTRGTKNCVLARRPAGRLAGGEQHVVE